MKHLIIACPVAAILFAAAGCSGSEVPKGAPSYLAVSNSKVAFIQWRTAPKGHLHGKITEAGVGGTAPAQTVSINSERFSGNMTGNSVTVTFAGLYFLHARAHGTLSGNTLTMSLPQSDGTVRQVRFSQFGKTGYERAVAALHRRIRHANQLAAKAQAGQRLHPANAQRERSAQTTLSAVYKASSLASGGILADSLVRFADHIHAARVHLAAEKKDASRKDKYCAAAFSATGHSKAVDGALQSVQGDVVSLMSDISNIRHDIVTATGLLHHLRKAGIAAQHSDDNVIANAKANLKQAIAKANSYIDQINAIDARAHSIADNMATRSCSGARSGNPVRQIPHIK
jgi:hypothetical protein